MTNFNEMKNATAVKTAARKEIFEKIMDFLTSEYGADNVSIIGSNEVAVCIGTRRDASGNENEVCVVIKPTAKDFENRITSKKTFTAFERLAAEKEYEISCEEKAEKEAKKEAEKAQKIAKSKT